MQYRSIFCLLALSLLLQACSGTGLVRQDAPPLAPLVTESAVVDAVEAAATLQHRDLLVLDDEMHQFLDKYVSKSRSQRMRLRSLHQALRARGILGIDYDPSANGSAAETFHAGRANCLSFAHLFVAMSREVGLKTQYQYVDTKPEWDRAGERLTLSIHVNAVSDLTSGERFEVDIQPLTRTRIVGTRIIDDEEAMALYYNNVGMEHFLGGDAITAFAHLAKAIELMPHSEYLWANVGAIYRSTGQHEEAEKSYRTALTFDPGSRTALNNLAVLYRLQGDEQSADAIAGQIARHRDRNPYYHYQLAETAEEQGQYQQAISHLREAINRKDSDAEFYFLLGQVLHKADRVEESIENLRLALQKAELITQREKIRSYLQELSGVTAM